LGCVFESGWKLLVARFNPDGSLEKTFSDGVNAGYGVYEGINDSSFTPDDIKAVAIDSSGRIFALGNCLAGNPAKNKIIVWAVKADGSTDNSFGSGGKISFRGASEAGSKDYGSDITIDSSGRILIAGYDENINGVMLAALWRLKTDGSPDPNFSDGKTSGFVLDSYPSYGPFTLGRSRGNSLVIDSADKIIVAGVSSSISESGLTVWRFNANGTPDQSFSSNGIKTFSGAVESGSIDIANKIKIDSAGRMVILGTSTPPDSKLKLTVVWRLK